MLRVRRRLGEAEEVAVAVEWRRNIDANLEAHTALVLRDHQPGPSSRLAVGELVVSELVLQHRLVRGPGPVLVHQLDLEGYVPRVIQLLDGRRNVGADDGELRVEVLAAEGVARRVGRDLEVQPHPTRIITRELGRLHRRTCLVGAKCRWVLGHANLL